MHVRWCVVVVVCTLLVVSRGEKGEGKCRVPPPSRTSGAPPPCGLANCPPESELLHAELSHDGCDVQHSHKVTLVTTAATAADDGTFNAMAIQGARAACRGVVSCCLEVDTPTTPVAEFKDYVCELEYGAMDSNLTIGVGFLHGAATERAADCFFGRKFAAIDVAYDTFAPHSNLEGIIFADDEAGFLAGTVAGLVASTTSSRVGIVAGPAIPPVARYVTGVTNAVAEYCDDCLDTLVIHCPDFGNIDNCGVVAAKKLISEGVGILLGAGGMTGSQAIRYGATPTGETFVAQGSTCGGVPTTFELQKTDAAVYVAGVDTDEFHTTFGGGTVSGAERVITSGLKRVDVAVQNAVANYFGGIAAGRNYRMDAGNGGIGFAPCNAACSSTGGPVTRSITARANTVRESLAAGVAQTRVDVFGKCSLPPGPGCPGGSSGEEGPPHPPSTPPNGLPLGIGVAAGSIACCALVCVLVMVVREKQNRPLFSSLDDPEETIAPGAAAEH